MKRGFVSVLILISFLSHAQSGGVDLSFNPEDPGFGFGRQFDGTLLSVQERSDGKYVCFGNFSVYNGVDANNLIVLNPDGSIDESFSVDPDLSGALMSVSLTQGDKLYVGGELFPVGSEFQPLARLNADGSIDNDFQLQGAFEFDPSPNITEVLALQNGSVVVSGNFDVYNEEPVANILVFNGDGTSDQSFDAGTGFFDDDESLPPLELVEDAQGRLLACGAFNTYNGTSIDGVCRINTDGTLDASFSENFDVVPPPAGGETIFALELLPDGRIALGGNFGGVDEFSSRGAVLLNSDGTLDESFDLPESGFDVGFGSTNAIRSLEYHPSGVLFIGGRFSELGSTLQVNYTAVNPDGSINEVFAPLIGASGQVNSILAATTDEVVFGGAFEYVEYRNNRSIFKLGADGAPVESFARGSSFSQFATAVEPVPNTTDIYVAGYFSHYKDKHQGFIVRLDDQGNLVQDFDPGIGLRGVNTNISGAFTLEVQEDGKPLIAGEFTTYDGDLEIPRFIRLNSDGSLDETFDIGGVGANFTFGGYNDLEVDSQGRIYIGGGFFQWNGQTANRIVRLNPDGSLDETFDSGVGPNGPVETIAIDDQDRVYIAGDFEFYGGESTTRVTRLNADGSRDEAFAPEMFNFNPTTVRQLVYRNGNILVAGAIELTDNPGVEYGVIALDEDGNPVDDFNPYVGGNVDLLSVDPFGRILLGLGTGSGSLIRLEEDGTVDPTWESGTGFEFGFLEDIGVGTDGSLYAVGIFTAYNGVGRQYIAKIINDEANGMDNQSKATFSAYPNPSDNQVTLALEDEDLFKPLRIFSSDGKLVDEKIVNQIPLVLDVRHWTPGIYVLTVGDKILKFNR
jgi:uncharacterized delta-60 repeat protein